MAECDRLESCLFFNDKLEDVPAASTLLKQQYCQKDFEHCARHRVETKLGSTSVPPDLFPQESARADRIVAGS